MPRKLLPNAAPKPKPAPPAKRQYSSIVDRRTHSEKIAASQRLRSTTPLKKKNAKRAKSEFARCFHSKARVEFVKSLPCIAYYCQNRDIDNAHIIDDGTKGASRRSGYACIAPVCRRHHTDGDDSIHHLGARRFEALHVLDLKTWAARTELAWREHELLKSEAG